MTKEITIFGVNFSKAVAKEISKKRFTEILPEKVKEEVKERKWKELCDFAGRKEKATPRPAPKKKKIESE